MKWIYRNQRVDRLLKKELTEAIKSILDEGIKENEVWLTSKELSAHFPFLTSDWINHNGRKLPRVRSYVLYGENVICKTKYCYPKSKIQKFIDDGNLNGVILSYKHRHNSKL